MGLMSYDPALNLVHYGLQSFDLNPKQRPGDNKWSMTIFARNPDTGMARWVYQMTPHDEWDYDGVNEMILTDQQIGGARRLPTHFDRNGLGYTLDRVTGELLVANKFDPKVNWTTGVDMNKNSPTYGRPTVVEEYSTDKYKRTLTTTRVSARPRWVPRTNSRRPIPRTRSYLYNLETNHVCMDYEPFAATIRQGSPMWERHFRCIRPRRNQYGYSIAWDGKTARSSGQNRAVLGLVGCVCHRRRRRFYGTLEGYLEVSMPRRARNSTSSKPRPASSATSRPMSRLANSISRCCLVSAVGRVSASPPV